MAEEDPIYFEWADERSDEGERVQGLVSPTTLSGDYNWFPVQVFPTSLSTETMLQSTPTLNFKTTSIVRSFMIQLAPPTSFNVDDSTTCELGVFQVLILVLMTTLACSTIAMNILVIFLFLYNKRIRSLGNMYYMSLAFADFLVGSVAMPVSIYLEFFCGRWPFGIIACDLFMCFDILGSTASIMHLCVIAVDRYKVIDDPLSYVRQLSRRRVFGTIAGVWLLSTAISFPGIAWWRAAEAMGLHKRNQQTFVDAATGEEYFQCELTTDVTYIILSSAVSFYIPLSVMSFVYYKIYQKAIAQSRFLIFGRKKVAHQISSSGGTSENRKQGSNRLRPGTPAAATTDSNGREIVLRIHRGGQSLVRLQQVQTQQRQPSVRNRSSSVIQTDQTISTFKKLKLIMKEHRAARTLGLIMGVFIVCWLPFFVFNVLSVFIPEQTRNGNIFRVMFQVVTWLGYLNSGLNPFLYGVSNRTFRAIYIRLLTCGRIDEERRKQKKREEFLASMMEQSMATELRKCERDRERRQSPAISLSFRGGVPPPISLRPTRASSLLATERLSLTTSRRDSSNVECSDSAITPMTIKSSTLQVPSSDISLHHIPLSYDAGLELSAASSTSAISQPIPAIPAAIPADIPTATPTAIPIAAVSANIPATNPRQSRTVAWSDEPQPRRQTDPMSRSLIAQSAPPLDLATKPSSPSKHFRSCNVFYDSISNDNAATKEFSVYDQLMQLVDNASAVSSTVTSSAVILTTAVDRRFNIDSHLQY